MTKDKESPAAQATSPAAGGTPSPEGRSPTISLPLATATEPIEADDPGTDDGYATDAASTASTSVSSSVRDYAFENNRRYHKFQEGRYAFPNDEPEQEREDMKHSMIIHVCGGALHLAPLKNPQSILDVGTGTGIWAIDVGDEYPEAQVLGIDLSPIQPSWVPPNVGFMVDDAEAEWLQQPGSVDYIHIRHMCSSIRDWPRLLERAYRTLKPGGWIELQELRFITQCDDGTMPDDHVVSRFLRNIKDGLAALGVDLLAMERNPPMVRDAGFTAVGETIYKVPLGTWPRDPNLKKIGLYNRSMILDGLQGISMGPHTRGLKWSPAEVELFLIDVRAGLMDSSAHIYLPFHVVIGQKPFAAS